MSREALKAHRIVGLQQQLHRIEEWRLADLDRALEEIAFTERDLIRALNEDDALQGLFIDATARRLRSLSEEASRLGHERVAQLGRLIEHGARKVCAERLAETLDRRDVQETAKRDLLDAIDRFIAPAAQASRKIAGG